MQGSLMTLQELAKYLKVAEITLRRWALGNKIPCFKIGKLWRFDKATIERWLASKEMEKSNETGS